jgi:hypothetical protein
MEKLRVPITRPGIEGPPIPAGLSNFHSSQLSLHLFDDVPPMIRRDSTCQRHLLVEVSIQDCPKW